MTEPRPKVASGLAPRRKFSDQRRGAQVVGKGLRFTYGPRRAPVFEGLDLTVQAGEALAVVGPSGCGKSTLLHMMAGLVRPSRGSLHIDDVRVEGPSPKWNLMLQKATLYPWLSVKDNVALALSFAGVKRKRALSVVDSILPIVGLENFAERGVRQLSGGQQQRVALARSLAAAPSLLLLDEPFSALDTFTRSRLQFDVRKITREQGMTQVLVTHDLEEAIRMSDRLLLVSSDPTRFFAGEERIVRRSDGGIIEDDVRLIKARVEQSWQRSNHTPEKN